MLSSPRKFSASFVTRVVDLLWHQWSDLGVQGQSRSASAWVLDPEAMMLGTVRFGRYDPRLFDAALEWCELNGKWINSARLLRLTKSLPAEDKQVLAAVAELLTKSDKSPKWRSLSLLNDKSAQEKSAPLFLGDARRSAIATHDADQTFLKHGLVRSRFQRRGVATNVALDNRAALRLRIRAFLGVTSRADIVTYLLAVKRARAAEVVRQSYFAQPPVARALTELASAGVLSEFRSGRDVEYELDDSQWFTFLRFLEQPVWTDWVVVFMALSRIHDELDRFSNRDISSSLLGAEFSQTATSINAMLHDSGVAPPFRMASPEQLESYPEIFEASVGQFLETLQFRSQEARAPLPPLSVKTTNYDETVRAAREVLRQRSQLALRGQTLREVAFYPEVVRLAADDVWPRETLLERLRDSQSLYRGNPFPLIVRNEIEHIPDGLLHSHEDIDGSFGTRLDYWYMTKGGLFYFAEVPWEDTYGLRVGGPQFANGIGVNSILELLLAGASLAMRLYHDAKFEAFNLIFALSEANGRHLVVDDPRREPFLQIYETKAPEIVTVSRVHRKSNEEQLRDLVCSMARDVFWAFGWSPPKGSIEQVVLGFQESLRRVARRSKE